jgi:dTDP-4-dehydrorhamnose reductase
LIKILVTGADGQLGNEFRKLAQSRTDMEFIFTDIGELDITNESEVNAFLDKNQVRYILNCAAYTAVDKAEEEQEKAYLLNAHAVGILAGVCTSRDIRLIHFSTDYIFDGTYTRPYREEDPPNPLTIYGLSKLEGEKLIRKANEYIIVRTSWLYSASGNNFVKTILRLCNEKNELQVVADQTGSPTWANDLARTVLMLIDKYHDNWIKNKFRIYHYSNEGTCTWYEFAREILKLNRLTNKIQPVGTRDYPTKAHRPAYSVLDKTRIKNDLDIVIPDWKESLKHCISELMRTHPPFDSPLARERGETGGESGD